MKLFGSKERIAQMRVDNPDISPKEIMDITGLASITYINSILKNTEVIARIEELKREALNEDILSYDETLKILSDIIKDTDESAINKIKAVESLQKLRMDDKRSGAVSGEGIPDNIIQPVIIQIPSNNRE